MIGHTLSKSDFKLARTCPTKLYYREMKYPDTSQDDEYLQLLAEGGYMVEAIAKLFHPDGIPLEYGGDQANAWRTTAEHLQRDKVTLFEATVLAGKRLVRVDILRKNGLVFDLFEVKAKSYNVEDADRRIEQTGSPFRTLRRKDGRYPLIPEWQAKYLEDITYQVDVLQEAFPSAEIRPHLVLVDKAHRTSLDGLPRWFRIERRETPDGRSRLHRVHFIGDPEAIRKEAFLKTVAVSQEVEELLPEVRAAAAEFIASLEAGPVRLAPVLRKDCRACEFRTDPKLAPCGWTDCWGARASVTPHILDLYNPPDQLDEWIAAGATSLFDIPEDRLVKKSGEVGARNERQLIQINYSRSNAEWIGPTMEPILDGLRYPLHFIDFEAARTAIPHHAGMRPYGQVAFQWSCHTLQEPGAAFEHREWINVDDLWPNHEFANTLREAIGDESTVLTWSHFERSVLNEIGSELEPMGKTDAELGAWLKQVGSSDGASTRIVDLYRLCLDAYFHPGMGGEASIKVVLDALWRTSPELRRRFTELTGQAGDQELGPYAALPPLVINGKERSVHEGTGAIRAYEAMIYGVERDDIESKTAWRDLLLRYCKLDTLAMVLIWEHWMRAVEIC